jgi:peptidoglycan lytic transglycosylase
LVAAIVAPCLFVYFLDRFFVSNTKRSIKSHTNSRSLQNCKAARLGKSWQLDHNSQVLVKTKLLLLALTLPLALFLFPAAQAQTASERHQRIRTALDAGDVATAINELRVLRSSDPGVFAANNYDYLLGKLSEHVGDAAGSQASYESVASRKSLLSSYALWHLAQLARANGDLVLERERLRQFLIVAPTNALREAAMLRLGKSFFESADYSAAINALRPLTESRNVPVAREALTLTGQAFLQTAKRDEARAVFSKLLMQMPDASHPDDFALAAARGLDSIDSPDGAKGAMNEAEHLLRASVYQFNRDFEGARAHYLAVVEQNLKNPTVPNALYQIGRGFYLEQRYDEALKYFQRVSKEFPDSVSARDALSFTAASYNRLKRTDDAVAAYKSFLDRFPDAPNPERTYLNIIDSLHEAGRHAEALSWAQQTRSRFAGQLGATLALFAQARIHLAQAAWAAVVADTEELRKASELGGTRVPSGTTNAEVTFLEAFALEQSGKPAEAVDLYLSITDGRNEYYGQRATDRLRSLANVANTGQLISARENALRADAKNALDKGQYDQARRSAQSALRLASGAITNESWDILKRAYQALPAYNLPALKLVPLGRRDEVSSEASTPDVNLQALADELLFLGVYDEAVPAVAAAQSATPTTQNSVGVTAQQSVAFSDRDYTLALMSLRGGRANDAVRFGERLWRTMPADYVLALAQRQLVELLYPAPYRESLLKHASARGVDPRFVLSIARQESRFQPEAKSVAAARGMMQFISATSDDVARQLGKSGFQQDELYNPDTAVLFGSQYLSSLFREFPDQPDAVAAAYNSGSDNVARWIARSRSNSPERYVSEIGFAQTKDYVFRVMTNLRAYQQLYDAKLERK